MEGGPSMIHMLIAERHTLMRSGIRRLLGDEPGLSVVAEVGRKASSGEEAVACIRKVARGQRHVSADVELTHLSLRHGLISPIEGRVS
jgi:hypothetical protein